MDLEMIHLISKFDRIVIKTAITDLKLLDLRKALSAALYFFPDGTGVDESNPRSFTALCNRYGADPDTAAKQVWGLLTQERQKLILELLKDSGRA